MVFIASLQVRSGDNKLVNLIEDWEVLEEYAGEKLGFYQLLGNDGTIEIRVQTGGSAISRNSRLGMTLTC